jgi:hypothetical protein
MTPAEEITRGEHAKRLLEDPLFKESMDLVKQVVIDQWVALGVENKAQAEELKRLLWAANQFEAVFVSLMGGATIARGQLLSAEGMQTKAEAVQRRINGT